MKKLKLLSLVLGISVIFFACRNGGDGGDSNPRLTNLTINADNVIEITPENLSIDVPDIYQNKKAFLLAINNTEETINVTNSRSVDSFQTGLIDNIETINENNSFSIPAKLPELNTKFTAKINNNRAANSNTEETPVVYQLGDKKDFYGLDSNNYFKKLAANAELKVIGKHCRIWYKEKTEIKLQNENGDDITDSALNALANDFDSIFEKETYIFGSNIPTLRFNELIDFTNCDKIDLIVYDLFDNYIEEAAVNSGIFGYFTEIDFYSQNFFDANPQDYQGYKSNECEALHIDSYWLSKNPMETITTAVHEFQHLLHCVNKTVNSGGRNRSESWFNEMLSMVCEDIMQSQVGVSDAGSPKKRLPLFNGYYIEGFTRWRDTANDGKEDVYHSYANAYVFGAYLLRNYGIDFIKELAHSNYINKEAITKALIAIGADEKSYNEVFSNFYNVILNPTGSKFTLNKSVSKTYTINDKQVLFSCDPIKLNEVKTIPSDNINEDLSELIYGSNPNEDFFGPVLLNGNWFNELDPSGMFATYLGTGEVCYDFSKVKSIDFNSNIGYYVVFVD